MTGVEKRPIIAKNLKTKKELHFESESDAARVLKLDRPTIVSIITKRPHRFTIHGWTFYQDVPNKKRIREG
jgi:hypothetical protein